MAFVGLHRKTEPTRLKSATVIFSKIDAYGAVSQPHLQIEWVYMTNLIRKNIILCLLDCESKSANEIADEIGESLASVEDQLTALISENICERQNKDDVSQYIVRKDIETFIRLVKEFLSKKKEDKVKLFSSLEEEIQQFITSEYYLTRIDNQLVDCVLKRFHPDSVYPTDEKREEIRRILLASPSALFFALHGDTTIFSEMYSSWNPLDPSDSNRAWITQRILQKLGTLLLEMLIADLRNSVYISLSVKLQIRVVKTRIQVELATPIEKYLEAVENEVFVFCRLEEEPPEGLRFGQSVTYVDPIDLSNDGLALLNLGECQAALNRFDDALNAVQAPNQKSIVLNNKGLVFLRLRQYQKAIECFEEGIMFDSEGELSELRENKQIAEKYLAIATDADHLTEPTQIRFIQNQPVPFEETRFYEFKEIKGNNPANRITKDSDKYAVAFLNSEGGRIFWGVRDDRTIVGVNLDDQQRDDVRRKVSEKLWSIRPPISDEDWDLEFHNVYDLQGNAAEDLWVVELVISPQQEKEVFYTNSGELFVKTPGGKQRLVGPQVTEFIRGRLQDHTETA